MSDHIQREKEFHNEAYVDQRRDVVNRFYRTSASYYRTYEKLLTESCVGKNVLEYGCGTGSQSFFLAKLGAEVTGIDISEEAIHQSEQKALELGVKEHTDFRVMNAEEMTFGDNSFDVVCGSAILHHLNLAKATSELNRVMKLGAVALFCEPLGHNPVINLYRKLTPNLRTPDEHPLLMRDLRFLHSVFPKMEISWHSLFTPYCAVLPLSVQKVLLPGAEKLDQFAFTIPFVRPLAWLIVISLRK